MALAYMIFGYAVTSNIALPAAGEPIPVDRPDLAFEVVDGPRDALDVPAGDLEAVYRSPFYAGNRPRVTLHRAAGRLDLRVAGCGRFLLSPGRVYLYRLPQAPPGLVADVFLGSVLSLWLEQCGLVTLHASAVADDTGRAMAFCGPSGAGKSTVAQHLVTNGFHLVADDVLALSPGADGIRCRPGLPSIRLTPASRSHFASRTTLTALPGMATRDKFYSQVPSICRDPAGLRAIYILERTARARGAAILRATPAEALISLLRNGFIACLSERVDPPTYLRRMSAVARQVPVGRLLLPDCFDALDRVASLLALPEP